LPKVSASNRIAASKIAADGDVSNLTA